MRAAAEVAGETLFASEDSTQVIMAGYGTFICRIVTYLWDPSLHGFPICSRSNLGAILKAPTGVQGVTLQGESYS